MSNTELQTRCLFTYVPSSKYVVVPGVMTTSLRSLALKFCAAVSILIS